ncbi:MAG: hypothetical protein R6U44_11020 [Archaeoglobaceae archaeon]
MRFIQPPSIKNAIIHLTIGTQTLSSNKEPIMMLTVKPTSLESAARVGE